MSYPEEQSIAPGEIARRFRQNYTNYHRLWTKRASIPEGVTLQTPDEEPITEDKLPAPLRAQLRAYKKAHPRLEVAIVKYMRTVNGRPEVIVEDETDVPREDQLLILSQTVTLTAHDSVQIITDLFVARRG